MAVASHPYDRHVGRYGSQLAAGLIDFAGVSDGDRVVDVGCGTGQLTIELANRVGGKNVGAIDVSEPVVEVCRARVPDADVRVGSAESLPWSSAEFDAALAQLVVNLVDDPPRAVGEMARVARPGGTVAACFWDHEEMPLLRSFWDACAAVAPSALAEVNEQARVGLPDVQILRQWWTGAGLADVALGEIEVAAEYESFDDLWFSFEAGVGHSGGLYRSLGPDEQPEVRAHAHRALGAPSAAFRLTAKAWLVRGRCAPPDR
jgi:SAM-dependent methyltransferase